LAVEPVARVDPRNRSVYWNDARIVGLSCLCADFTDHAYSPHSHDALVVAVTEAGGISTTKVPPLTISAFVCGITTFRCSNVLCARKSLCVITVMLASFAVAPRNDTSVSRASVGLGFTAVIVNSFPRVDAEPCNPQNAASFPSRS